MFLIPHPHLSRHSDDFATKPPRSAGVKAVREEGDRLARELQRACHACIAAKKSGDTSAAQLLTQCDRIFATLSTLCADGVLAASSDASLTPKLLETEIAAGCADAASTDVAVNGETWSNRHSYFLRVRTCSHVAELVAEIVGDTAVQSAAHDTWNAADYELTQLYEANLPEIESRYEEISAAIDTQHEAERRSALCATARALSRARRPVQARARTRRPRRARPRRPASSSDGEGEEPRALRDRGAPTCPIIAARSEERAP